jgi:hypothetical protein
VVATARPPAARKRWPIPDTPVGIAQPALARAPVAGDGARVSKPSASRHDVRGTTTERRVDEDARVSPRINRHDILGRAANDGHRAPARQRDERDEQRDEDQPPHQ